MLKMTLYGHDRGANDVLDSVVRVASEEADMDIVRIPSFGVPVSDGLKEQLYQSDAAIFGISSDTAAGSEARLALEALQRKPALSGKIFFVEDFPGSSGIQDPDHRKIGPHAHLCSIEMLPRDAPEWTVYRGVHAVGIPDHWGSAMTNILDAEGVRQRDGLVKRLRGTITCVSVLPNEIVVYLPGFKDPVMEERMLRVLLSINEIGGRPVLVHFRPHPGECHCPELAQAIVVRDAFLTGQWELANPKITDPSDFQNARLIGASDISIAHPGAIATFHVAALRRQMVCPMEFVTEENRRGTSYDCSRAVRYAHVVEHLDDVPDALTALLDCNSSESMALRRRQEAHTLAFDPEATSAYGKRVMEEVSNVVG